MSTFINAYQSEIEELCRRYRVEKLDLFGSATTNKFDIQNSDLDFIVRFSDLTAPGISRRFFGLAEDLEQLFDRPVDLITDQSFQNPYFAQAVAETRETIYDQRNEKTAV